MPKRISDEARILNFFSEADLGKAESIYNLVRDVMGKRLAPARAVRAANRKPRGRKAGSTATTATTATGPAE